jgi:hypothetical protein
VSGGGATGLIGIGLLFCVAAAFGVSLGEPFAAGMMFAAGLGCVLKGGCG